jgi:hypothetical protein
MEKKRRGMSKKGLELEMIGWWILGLAVLVIAVLAFVYFKNQGMSAIDYVKNLFILRK